ncbi:hypothetical protein J6590_019419 [Homalodisca vitripennis]|nr:hypothetical protein J6590_019419 [Homalodisca vitripennis]
MAPRRIIRLRLHRRWLVGVITLNETNVARTNTTELTLSRKVWGGRGRSFITRSSNMSAVVHTLVSLRSVSCP